MSSQHHSGNREQFKSSLKTHHGVVFASRGEVMAAKRAAIMQKGKKVSGQNSAKKILDENGPYVRYA